MKAIDVRGKNNILLAVYIDRKILAATDGAQFHTSAEDQLQLATMLRPKGHTVKAHKHVGGARTVWKTQEVLVVVRGKLQVTVYDLDGSLVSVLYVSDGEAILLVDGGHAVQVIEETVFYEIKTGPFLGPSDKVPLLWDGGPEV
jgi:cupin fold WbuC family metalloprotein